MNTGTGVAGYVPSPYIVNLINLQNTIENITGINPLDSLSNAVTNIQQMVNFDEKRIFTNVISRFDQTPIQITDDINLSNANLYQNDVLINLGAIGGGGGGSFISSAGGNAIYIISAGLLSTNIGFQIGGRTVFGFDGQGNAKFYDPSGIAQTFWISSATLVADKVQFGGSGLGAAEGKFLMSKDSLGTGVWSYVSTLRDNTGVTNAFLSSDQFLVNASNVLGGGMDPRRNWYFGNPAFTGSGDLASSNDVTVIGGGLRVRTGAGSIGQALVITDSLGNVGFSNASGSLSSFVIGDQIASGTTSVRTVGGDNSVRFTTNASEKARLTSPGYFGIGTLTPETFLDVNGTSIFRGAITMSTANVAADWVLTSQDSNGTSQWARPEKLFDSAGDVLRVSTGTSSIMGFVRGKPILRFSTNSASFATRLDVSGLVIADGFSAYSPLRFFVGAGATEVGRFTDSGNFGIGVVNPTFRLQVAGSQSNTGNLQIGGVFRGDGSLISNIQTSNVGSGFFRLDTFQGWTVNNISALQTATSTTYSNLYSTIIGTDLGATYFSTLSSYLTITSNALSSQIGPGAAQEISSFSTALGASLAITFSNLSVSIVTNTVQFSTLSSQTQEFASTISFQTASTLDMAILSTVRGSLAIGRGPYAIPPTLAALEVSGNVLLDRDSKLWLSTGGKIGVGYKVGQDLSGAVDVSGLIYSRGLRGLQAPFGFGVGASTTTVLNAGGYSPGEGWRLAIQGDLDISGLIYRNGTLYDINGVPDMYWAKNGSNLFYATGNVGIGVISPSYPLDVAGKIRCFGVDIIPGPGPIISSGQGSYVSPWFYQGSNIYYNLGGVGIGTGISSVQNGIFLDISGAVRQRYGPVYLEQSTLGIGIPFGSTLQASLDVSGSIHGSKLNIDTTGEFGGNITTTAVLVYSDERLKTDIQPLEDPDTILQSVNGVRFRWKKNGRKDVGFLAQQVQKVLPEAVYENNVAELLVAYDKMIPVLVESLKSVKQRVVNLEQEVSTLKNR